MSTPERDAGVSQLEERLARYPPERYPVQHATARFHLAMARVREGRLAEAEGSLEMAARLFDPEHLPAEHAKARNARGAVLRLMRRAEEAEEDFERAAALFAWAGDELERAAALHNVGLIRRETGNPRGAVEPFRQAAALFERSRDAVHAGAAARELGAVLLEAGEPEEAREALERALALSRRAGDEAGTGAALNALGLTRLAQGHAEDAVGLLREAAAAHPRSVRPADHAMAKANLALAWERVDESRARLAALQGAGVPGAPGSVLAQARAVLDRVGDRAGAVVDVLESEVPDAWPALLREEVARWADADDRARRSELDAWIDGQLAAGDRAVDRAEALLRALLEMPPPAMERVVATLVEEHGRREEPPRARVREQVRQAAARFHAPQILRLQQVMNRLAAERGLEAAW